MIKEEIKIISCGSYATGEEINIKKYSLISSTKGRHIYIQGGIHGGEVTLDIIKELFDFLKENLISGQVDFVPYANPLSWNQKAYTYTVGKFSLQDGKDFNRCYGKDGNINNKIANNLLKECLGCDLTLDLHTSQNGIPHTNFASLDLKEYIKLLNLDFNYFCGMPKEYQNAFDTQCLLKNTPSITIECGRHDDLDENNKNQVIYGIKNILANLKMIDLKNANQQKKSLTYFEKTEKITTENAGIVEFLQTPGSKIKKGQELYKIIPADLTKTPVIIRAKNNGFLFRNTKTHICNSYDELGQVVYDKDFKNL